MVTSIYPENFTIYGQDLWTSNLEKITPPPKSESVNKRWKHLFNFPKSTSGEFPKEWFRFQENQTSAKAGGLEVLNFSDFPEFTETTFDSYRPFLQLSLVLVAGIIIIIVIIFGNALVLVAILGNRRLKVIQNWMVASVALSDLLVGILVLPQKLTNNLLGYWILSQVMCDIWLVIGDLLRTATAFSLVVMVLDR